MRAGVHGVLAGQLGRHAGRAAVAGRLRWRMMLTAQAPRATRPLPRVGMEVGIVHLGVTTPAVVEQVLDGGRRVVAGGETFELSRLTARFVRTGDPYYGVRLALARDA